MRTLEARDAKGQALKVGDYVEWSTNMAGKRKVVKKATITAIQATPGHKAGEALKITVFADIDNGTKGSLGAFITLAELAEQDSPGITFHGITKL